MPNVAFSFVRQAMTLRASCLTHIKIAPGNKSKGLQYFTAVSVLRSNQLPQTL
jgi:hypothetical protein